MRTVKILEEDELEDLIFRDSEIEDAFHEFVDIVFGSTMEIARAFGTIPEGDNQDEIDDWFDKAKPEVNNNRAIVGFKHRLYKLLTQ